MGNKEEEATIIVELKGRKGKHSTENVYFYINEEILNKIPITEELRFKEDEYGTAESLYSSWGIESDSMPGFRRKVYTYTSDEEHGYSILPQVLKDVKKLKKLVKKGLNAKVYKEKTFKVSL